MKLEGQSLTPLYQQVIEDIRNLIETGAYPVGTKIPSEDVLSDHYGVSRITVRRAISGLADDGYLTKRQGKGTFVNCHAPEEKIELPVDAGDFAASCRKAGRKSGARKLNAEREEGSERINRALAIEPEEGVLTVSRVRTAGGVAVLVERHYLPYRTYGHLESTGWGTGSVLAALEKKTGRHLEASGERSLEIEHAGGDMAELLGVPLGEPLFREERTYCDEVGTPVMVSCIRYLGSAFRFVW